MLELLSLLQLRRDWSGDVLAERFDVSPRTVRRDIERLRDLGYSIEALRGPAGGYRLSAGSHLPPLLFDDEQAVAVALALAVAPSSGADIAEAAARSLATIRKVMPLRLRHRVDAVNVQVASGNVTVDPAVLVAVSEATSAHEILRFDYAPVRETAETDRRSFRVEPHAVIARDGRWYLLAWNADAHAHTSIRDNAAPTEEIGDWRTYRIDRVRPGLPTRQRFAPRRIPGGDAVAFVAARFRGSRDANAAWPCVGTAVLDLPPHRVAPFVDPDARMEEGGDGRTKLTTGSWSWRALAARFAGFDCELQIVGPQLLQDAAVQLGRRLITDRGLDAAPKVARQGD